MPTPHGQVGHVYVWADGVRAVGDGASGFRHVPVEVFPADQDPRVHAQDVVTALAGPDVVLVRAGSRVDHGELVERDLPTMTSPGHAGAIRLVRPASRLRSATSTIRVH